MKDDKVYLRHIVDAVLQIDIYIEGQSKQQFLRDPKTIDAVIRQIEIVGKAANKLSSKFKKLHDNVPWSQVIGMRNKLIHEYFGVNKEIVWETILKDLPVLQREITILIDKYK